MPDDFFTRDGTPCDRCSNTLGAFTMSWFTEDVICMNCSSKEKRLKAYLREAGKDPRDYEGCGYIPTRDAMGEEEL